MHIMNKNIVVLIFLFVCIQVQSVAERYAFKHITMDNGLSHNQVNCIYRDADGFMWFATASGLTRYDGYTMRVFSHQQDSVLTDYNYIAWITDWGKDKLIGLSIGTYFLFDKHTETFSSANKYFESFGVPTIDNLFVDSQMNVWIVSGQRLFVFSYSQKTMLTSSDGVDLGEESVVTSLCEHNAIVYLMCNNGTLLLVPMSNAYTAASIVRKQTPAERGTHHIFVDSDADYWIYTDSHEGLWYYKSDTKNWYRCTNSEESTIRVPAFVINSMAEDAKHCIWVTSNHGGACVVNKHTQSVTNVQSNKNDSRSVQSNSLNCVYCDVSGNVWIGTVRSGISVYNESVFKFSIDDLSLSGVPTDFVPQINTIEEDKSGNMWYGSNGSGLLCVPRNGKAILYRHLASDAGSIPNDIIVDVLADSKGRIWVGSFLGGLSYFDGTKFFSFKGKKEYLPSVNSENIWAIAEDNAHNIWVGSLGKGLAVCNAKTGQWKEFNSNNSVLPTDYISQIVPTADNNVFVSTSYGVVQCDADGHIKMVGANLPAVMSNVNDIFVDSRGLLWVGSDNGLTVLDGQTFEQCAYFDTKAGLQHNVITGIVEDTDRNMWITTTCGISNIIVNINPRTNHYSFTIYGYDEHDGMMQGALNVRSVKRTSYGEIIVGGNYGIARFYPNKIKYNKETPTPIFTSLSVLGHEVGIGEEYDGHVILQKAMPYTDSIVLNYSDNMFTVSFSTLSSVLPEKVTYSYNLEGFSDKWIPAEGHSVTYTNLTYGNYTLKVRASNCDGFSSLADAELHIRILPPWWRTTTAYVSYAIILLLLIVFVVFVVRRRELEKYNLKQLEAEIEKKSEIDEMKLRFFTNVSHELRTPLSLIISPLESLLSTITDETVKSKLDMMHRNAQSLLSIVNQLLDLRKTDSNAMQLNLSEGDLVSFVQIQSDDFAQLSERDIKFSFATTETSIYTQFDKDKISKVLNNILSNALKYTPDGGSITTTVSLTDNKQSALISIADTGIGIPDEHKKQIFERFYQVPRTEVSYGGSGIGLHLVKEFVGMHGGTVAATDNEGGGTIFSITLPLRAITSTEPDTEEVEPTIGANGRKRIIVVDDNADFRTLITEVLSDEFDIVQAKNGQEAFEQIVRIQPDIIISDVMMPVMDGNQLCQKVKSDIRTSHIPFVMLTAKTAEEHRIEGLSAGADDYIPKPFNAQILKLRVAKLIDLATKRHAAFHKQIEPEPSEITITTLDEKLIQKAVKYVEDNISSTELSVEELSKHLGMSRVHLYKKLLSITGHTPIEFIRIIRLKRAAQMLKDKQQNVSDVAYAVGFNNPKYFSKYFRDEFGMLPSVYQNNTEGINKNIEL